MTAQFFTDHFQWSGIPYINASVKEKSIGISLQRDLPDIRGLSECGSLLIVCAVSLFRGPVSRGKINKTHNADVFGRGEPAD